MKTSLYIQTVKVLLLKAQKAWLYSISKQTVLFLYVVMTRNKKLSNGTPDRAISSPALLTTLQFIKTHSGTGLVLPYMQGVLCMDQPHTPHPHLSRPQSRCHLPRPGCAAQA